MGRGTWPADRTGLADGLAHALQNRRRLGRVVPELFASQLPCHIDPFVELCLDMLRRASLGGTAALLTPGHADPAWYGHVLLARELSCALVEGGDLTVRDGGLFLKTLRGLQPIGVLLRGIAGDAVDPLELEPDGIGVPGLLAAARDQVRIINSPGSGLVEAPALAAFLPDLAMRLLGEKLALPSVPTVWLGNGAVREAVLRTQKAWSLRPALEGGQPPVPLAAMAAAKRGALLERVEAAPWRFAASTVLKPSVAPCLDGDGLVPRPVLVRMFLVRDRGGWRAMPGGLGCVLPDDAQAWPSAGPVLAKDVWVLAENPAAIEGLRLRRARRRWRSGAPPAIMPSRVADNFFWLGRYLERLEGAARLLRITIGRVGRPAPTPHEIAELDVLIACLTQAGLLNAEAIAGLGPAGLGQALLRVAGSWGSIHALLGQVSRVTGLLRDQVTGEMHAVTARGLREVEEALGRIPARGDGQALDATFQAMSRVLAFSATLSGLAAENMVRGGGRLFLDLGPARGARAGGGRPDRLRAGVPRRGAAAGARGARAAPGAGAVRFVDHLSQPLSGGAAAGAGARPAAGGRRQSARPGVPACRDARAAERDRRRQQTPRSPSLQRRCRRSRRRWSARSARPPTSRWRRCSCRRGCARCAMRSPSCRIACRGSYFALLPTARTVGIEASRPIDARGGVIYRVRHVTRYDYQTPVDLGAHLAHLRPRPLPHQQVLRAGVHAAPAVSWRRDGSDHFGNEVTWLFLDVAHAAFQVIADATVDVAFPDPARSAATPPWETVARQAWEAGAACLAGRRVPVRQSACPGRCRRQGLCGALLRAGPPGAGGAARPECQHPPRLHLPRRRDDDEHADRRGAAAARGRVPGLHPPDDQRAARLRPAGALCLRLHPHPSVTRVRPSAPTSRMPGSAAGLGRSMAGWTSIPPTASWCGTSMS